MPPIPLRFDVLAWLSLAGVFLVLWHVQELWLKPMDPRERYPAWARGVGAGVGTFLCYTVATILS